MVELIVTILEKNSEESSDGKNIGLRFFSKSYEMDANNVGFKEYGIFTNNI